MDNFHSEDRLLEQVPSSAGGLPPLIRFLQPRVRGVAVAYRQHTGVDVQRIELRTIDAEGTVKEMNFPIAEAR